MVKNMSLKKKMALGWSIPIFLISILGILSYQSMTAMMDIGKKADLANEIINDIDTINNSVSNLESYEMKFLVTGDEQ